MQGTPRLAQFPLSRQMELDSAVEDEVPPCSAMYTSAEFFSFFFFFIALETYAVGIKITSAGCD